MFEEEECAGCGVREAREGGVLQVCGDCMETRYCSRECQIRDRQKHKEMCKKKERAAA